jgi:glutathione peroxidase
MMFIRFCVASFSVGFLLLVGLTSSRAATAPDEEPGCSDWADIGECDHNPGYMLVHCATSCEKAVPVEKLEGIESFYDLSAPDINGNTVNFADFRGKVVILTNVASHCGYTESHYTQLVDLWGNFKDGDLVEILAFPCNQFGQQEPGSAEEIKSFVEQKGVTFRMMQKINVNGPAADTVYKFLKREAGPSAITWNFATYYVVSPDGQINAYSGLEPRHLKTVALSLLKEEL